ncbi:DUF418 domain-containing protein [Massilia atriviolacea]|uniref:DUF418 domain-containing protein n=1 Tax=Massilia atriviolacea TaxID=2495579 RepID=A0A430HPK1_9BURK|nr:DUF418 domain-containing protein [Massilia atriviolacea]RSZ59446.1 DUF418 domain-containing protein [Massilia atriviolacea]
MGSHAPRLDVVDTLRGFAVVSIMLLHNIEHFDLYYVVPGAPAWLAALDKIVWEVAFFLFGGKSYAIFALLFGLTFHLQSQARQERGEDFRVRYGWRLLVLFGFGMLNSMFFHGDILTIYAVLGLCLLPAARLRDGALLALAAVLMLQPYEWLVLAGALRHPDALIGDPVSWQYFGRINDYLAGDSVLRAWAGNLTNGKLAVIHWSWENGRVFQIVALFMLGMLAGRRGLFAASANAMRFWRRTLLAASALFLPLYTIRTLLPDWVASAAVRRPLGTIVASWSNVALMLVLVACFVLLYQGGALTRALRVLAPLGRMSLTAYFTQSVVGSFIYYGFGLGLYKVTGASVCLLIGVVLAALQCAFCAWWLRRHAQGPLERLWHRATWIGARRAA